MNNWIWILLLFGCCKGSNCGCGSRCCEDGRRNNRNLCNDSCGCDDNVIQPRTSDCDCKDNATMPMPIFAPEKDCDCDK